MAIVLRNPASDLAAALTGNTVGGVALTTGTNLFKTMIHPMPWSLCVQLLNTGGTAPQPYIAGSTPESYFRSNVQVLVYGTPGEDGFEAGETLARGVIGQLMQTVPTGYVSVFAVESQPSYVGADPETQRHVWSFNLRAEYKA